MYKINPFFITPSTKVYLQLIEVSACLCTIASTGEQCYLSLIREQLAEPKLTCTALLSDSFGTYNGCPRVHFRRVKYRIYLSEKYSH